MPRGDEKIDAPFRAWVVLVDENNRVRLPVPEVRAVVPWIDVETGRIECVGTPGPSGGVQVLPVAEYRQDLAPFAGAFVDLPPGVADSSQQWMEVARLLATAWLIPIYVEASQIRFTLPEQPRRAEQVPQAGQPAVVFGFGNILEIWDALKWHDHIRGTAKRKAAMISEALEDLMKR